MTASIHEPHIRIENTFIDKYLPKIGPYGYTIYSVLKRHLNHMTGDCFPSYKTIAKKSGIDRSTVIRYVKKLKDLNLISPEWRFKEDGAQTSNQYNFQGTENSVPSKKPAESVQLDQGGGSKQLPVGRSEPPKQSEQKKKERTIPDINLSADRQDFHTENPLIPHSEPVESHKCPQAPTKRQQDCTHPAEEIVHLSDNITICNHCFGFLEEEKLSLAGV